MMANPNPEAHRRRWKALESNRDLAWWIHGMGPTVTSTRQPVTAMEARARQLLRDGIEASIRVMMDSLRDWLPQININDPEENSQ